MNNITLVFIIILLQIRIFAQNLYFPPINGNTWDTISPQSLGYCQTKIDSLYSFLDSTNTKAFILLKNGKIVLEKYFQSHTQNSYWYWASAGKTLTAFIIGIAQQEGYLSITDTTSKFLGQGWTTCTPEQEEKITIRHQLTMTTGLDDNVPDPYCTIDTCLIYKADAGTRWAYHNAPYTLLDRVIEVATGTSLNNYLSQKLLSKIGMQGSFFQIGFNNVFFSDARSMARFGLLILNKGNWNGTQIMNDSAYFEEMINTSQNLNKSYGYLWWLNGKESFMVPASQFVFNGPLFPDAPADMISAIGKDGQFLNIVPSQNLIWLRLGESPDNLPLPFLLNNEIWRYINDLNCLNLLNNDYLPNVKLYPNPTNDFLFINANKNIVNIELYNIYGKIIKEFKVFSKEIKLPISTLDEGFYFIKLLFNNNQIYIGKILKTNF